MERKNKTIFIMRNTRFYRKLANDVHKEIKNNPSAQADRKKIEAIYVLPKKIKLDNEQVAGSSNGEVSENAQDGNSDGDAQGYYYVDGIDGDESKAYRLVECAELAGDQVFSWEEHFRSYTAVEKQRANSVLNKINCLGSERRALAWQMFSDQLDTLAKLC